ncbi:MAG: bifunctional phosphoribosylaminoimidazolecarboxamide formyltransferase/IMP cyclohydrolase [Candidatus Dormibacteraeota bacterium]|uniref:Bifunctional purine biosynthesis protein PurH n=1 Tax=Candidatus Dormiibacter inghamiae TaxID=3127013 RepID=A0A934K6X1_9BACT|nr:bifunctional phosphoribosylaminoimidazolecarboxamide formyltransferase/IMP cyclohydrolase [Candidatus Dormibacteraeota bacterium]MBJ7606638.1 bifunctional phosphoribosylaminoimidazolecarboxamide formyltransferase/IMP cyclohydrolase [Candidatus Dormibacteraeota bacterium]
MSKRALLSVTDKSGLPAFARGLVRLGYEVYSTGGTQRMLEEAAIDALSVSKLTDFPEILDGRVKTLHPAVHAGLLARRDVSQHLETLNQHGLQTIDLLCVNLYPFAETRARPGAGFDEILDQIDIGGPAMIRSAAKNHSAVVVVVRPERYSEVLGALGSPNGVSPELRRRLAAEAFAHTAACDAQIAAWLEEGEGGFPAQISFSGSLVRTLRYGENPHQRAAFYRSGAGTDGLGSVRQLHGGELSYNNIQDAAAAFELARDLSQPAAAIIKHTNPCGVAAAEQLADAYRAAYNCDTTSAYGGVVAVNRELDSSTAGEMAGIFLEVVVAPSVDTKALAVLSAKENLRILEVQPSRSPDPAVRSVPGGLLVQDWDRRGFDRNACQVATQRQPTAGEWAELEFAWLVVKHVRSNAIVLARDRAAVGVGAGQMSRVEASQLAVQRAGERARGSVLASDAYFPFPDGLQVGIEAGVTAVIQPGGAKRDSEVIAAADAAGVAMVFTGERHFRH